jgi:hypothetical protein
MDWWADPREPLRGVAGRRARRPALPDGGCSMHQGRLVWTVVKARELLEAAPPLAADRLEARSGMAEWRPAPSRLKPASLRRESPALAAVEQPALVAVKDPRAVAE